MMHTLKERKLESKCGSIQDKQNDLMSALQELKQLMADQEKCYDVKNTDYKVTFQLVSLFPSECIDATKITS